MNMPVKRQQRLAGFDEPADRDAAERDIKGDMINHLALSSGLVEFGFVGRDMKEENRSGHILVLGEPFQIILDRHIFYFLLGDWIGPPTLFG